MDDRFQVFARSGSTPTQRDAVEWAVEAEARGAGEVLLTSIDRDGTRSGFDCELTAAVSTRGLDPGDRVRRRRHVRSLHARCSRPDERTRRSPPPSFTSPNTPSPI